MFPNGIASFFEDPEGVNTPPISYDRVNGGRPIHSRFPIFQLPIELFSSFAPYFSNKDLAALALVDRDCRQWSRSMQFSSVTLDHSSNSSSLFWHLQSELGLGCATDLSSSNPALTLNSCIRKLTVLGPPPFVTKRHRHTRERLVPDNIPSAMQFLCKDLECRERNYYRLLSRIIKHLPNLQVVDWNCSMVMEVGISNNILRSNAKHLRLNNVRAGRDSTTSPCAKCTCHKHQPELRGQIDSVILEEERLEDGSIPLETLVAGVSWPMAGSEEVGDIAPFLSELIRVSAPTLRNLAFRDWSPSALTSGSIPRLAEGLPRVRRIHNLVLDEICIEQLDKFLGPQTTITSLTVDSLADHSRNYLVNRGNIASLEHLHWIYAEESFSDMMQILDSNRQLTFFAISTAIPTELITSTVLPKFASTFHSLTSLNIKWSGNSIPEESLALVAKIRSLRNLWVSSGCQSGSRHTWEVDHTLLRDTLKSLTGLETLAVSRDTYKIDVHALQDPDPASYYMNQNLPNGVSFADYLDEHEKNDAYLDGGVINAALTDKAWERWHRSMMSVEAQKYADCFKRLTWCFVGQICWDVVNEKITLTPNMDAEAGKDLKEAGSIHRCYLRKVITEHAAGERDHDLKCLHGRWGIVNEFPL